MARYLLPVGTDIEVFDPEDHPDSMPIYSGGVEDAFMSLTPGLYPFTHETFEDTGGGDMQDVARDYLLVVTQDESFAVSTAVEYVAVHPVDTSADPA